MYTEMREERPVQALYVHAVYVCSHSLTSETEGLLSLV